MTSFRRPATSQDFYDLAMKYCANRETSRARMESYLMQKARSADPALDSSSKKQLEAAIQDALNQLERQKVIDDQRYASLLVRDYQRRAKGAHYVEGKLREKGLESQLNSVPRDPEDELLRAAQAVTRYLETARFKKIENPFELKQKLTQKLLASGFDLTISKKAVALKVR